MRIKWRREIASVSVAWVWKEAGRNPAAVGILYKLPPKGLLVCG